MRRWVGIAPWLAALAALGVAQEPASRARVAVDRVIVPVRDLAASLRFYTEVLPCRLVARGELQGDAVDRHLGQFGVHGASAVLQLGDERLELVEFLTPRGRALPADARSDDRWFQHVAIVVADMDRAYAHLRAHRVAHASPSPQTLPAWNQAAGGIRAFYFHDPDGQPLELIWFPPGKGAAKWQQPGRELFLGIDHTAIVVADTAASLRFWRDELGLVVAGGSENHGPEQERLNRVFGARLRITTLRGSAGPGVELLEYLTPRTGRPYPADSAAADLWCWTIVLQHDAAEPLWSRLLQAGAAVSATFAAGDGGAVVRDPDGHRVGLGAPLVTPGR